MFIYFGIIAGLLGSLVILSLCKAAGRADELQEKMLKRERDR
jgi:hypothetical protein